MVTESRATLRYLLRGFLSEAEVSEFRDEDLDILLRERYVAPAVFQRCTKEDLREVGVPMRLVTLLLLRLGKIIVDRSYDVLPLRPHWNLKDPWHNALCKTHVTRMFVSIGIACDW